MLKFTHSESEAKAIAFGVLVISLVGKNFGDKVILPSLSHEGYDVSVTEEITVARSLSEFSHCRNFWKGLEYNQVHFSVVIGEEGVIAKIALSDSTGFVSDDEKKFTPDDGKTPEEVAEEILEFFFKKALGIPEEEKKEELPIENPRGEDDFCFLEELADAILDRNDA